MRLKSLMPRSLYGRAALILVVPIVTIQLVVSMAFIQRHFEGVTRQLTSTTRVSLSYLQKEIDRAPDLATARQRAHDLAEGLDLGVILPSDTDPATEDLRAWWDLSGRTVLETLRDAPLRVEHADLVTNPRDVSIWLTTRHGQMEVTVDRRRLSATNSHQLLVIMLATSVFMTLIASIFLRNQLRPINRLAIAADAFGKGRHVAYKPAGATEVRLAGFAFLDMRARIERQIESRTLMLSGVSHDLRTPLTRLRLGLAMLPEDEEVEALQQDVAQMQHMVDAFLAFARGDALDALEATDPIALTRQLVDRAQRGGLPVTLDQVEGEGVIELRPRAIERAIDNLIGNAVRHGTRAVVSVHLTERALRFVVEDDGPGIPRDRREEALRPFTRLDSARDPNHGGSVGLGLSISADIARSHGGTLRLGDSESLGGLKAEIVLGR